MKNKIKTDQCFFFGPVTFDNILKKTYNIETAKASQQSDIPTKILKQNSKLFCRILLWKYKPVYFEINVYLFKSSRCNSSL